MIARAAAASTDDGDEQRDEDYLDVVHRTTPSSSSLGHLAALDQQVDVPEHLGQSVRNVCVSATSPQIACAMLVRRARLLVDQPEDLARPALVHREAVVDQGGVVAERIAMARAGRS